MKAFSGPLSFCSNFYFANCEYDGIIYRTSEHAFQAAKTLDKAERVAIMNAATPAEAKKLGRKVKMRDNWNDIRCAVMYEILCSKFSDPKLAKMLVDTGDEPLVEVNWWGDIYWGQCPAGVGENNLGKILMQIREELK